MLTQHFDELRSGRGETPIYLLEHGLWGANLDALFRSIRACLRIHTVSDSWWKPRALPLLIAATEIGYSYRGTGTDFWPIFAERFGEISLAERPAFSMLFDQAGGRYCLARPPETPWNQAFCHIAWPVLQAILPLELHRPLAQALREVRAHLLVSGDDAALVAPIRGRAQLAGNSRLLAWLEDHRTAAAVVRQLISPNSTPAIANSALTRIAADLAADETANAALRDARKRQKALEAQPVRRSRRKTVVETRFAPLVLRSTDHRLSLSVKFPQMEPKLRDMSRVALDAMRWRAFLWSQGRPVPGRNIFSDYPMPLNVEALPGADRPLFEDVASLPLPLEAKDFLSSLRVNTAAPILFSDFGPGGDALQLSSAIISETGTYVILVAHEQPPSSAEALGRVAGLRTYRVDASAPDVQGWLSKIGLSVREIGQVAWVGDPELEQHRPTRRYRQGSYVAFEVTATGGACDVWLDEPNGNQSNLRAAERVLAGLTAEQLGTYTLRYGAGEAVTFEVVADNDDEELISVNIDAGAGAIGDLADRHFTLRFDSTTTLQEAEIQFRLVCDGREAASVRDVLPDTPCRLNGDHSIWDALLTPDCLERLLLSDTAELCVSIPGLLDANFRFERATAPFVWQRDSAGELHAVDETGVLDIFVALPQAPLAIRPAGPLHNDTDIILLRAGRGNALQIGGLCLGPKVWRPSEAHFAQAPIRLLRRLTGGGGDTADAHSVVDALISWSATTVDHPVTQFRRGQVVRQLEQWLIQELCGAEWAAKEVAVAAGRETSFASAFLAACVQLGIGYAIVELSREQLALLDRILLRLIEAERLPITLQTSREPIDDDLAAALDGVFNEAYSALCDLIEFAGEKCAFNPDIDIDVGEVSERWDRALRLASTQAAFIELVDLLRPLEAGDTLSLADFETMLPDDVVDLLHDWIATHRPSHHSRRWNRDLVESSYWLFTKPSVAARLPWQSATERLLADSFSARAIRYAALRASGALRRNE